MLMNRWVKIYNGAGFNNAQDGFSMYAAAFLSFQTLLDMRNEITLSTNTQIPRKPLKTP